MRPIAYTVAVFLVTLAACHKTVPDASLNRPLNTGNTASDRLGAKSPKEAARALGEIVGPKCRGTRAFYQGVDVHRGAALWDVQCADGQSFVVEITPDAAGTSHTMSCQDSEVLAHIKCFEKLADQ